MSSQHSGLLTLAHEIDARNPQEEFGDLLDGWNTVRLARGFVDLQEQLETMRDALERVKRTNSLIVAHGIARDTLHERHQPPASSPASSLCACTRDGEGCDHVWRPADDTFRVYTCVKCGAPDPAKRPT